MPRDKFDVLILGGGTAGCVLASRLSEDEERAVCLVEAGPDYGPFDGGGWPADMLDGRLPPDSHDWRDEHGRLPVARIVGGCSAHNMCTLMHGAPSDYDGWAEATGDEGLRYQRFAPYLRRVEDRMALRRFADAELDPWFRGLSLAAEELGLAVHEDANDPAAAEGVGRVPFNLRGTTRWNAAFGYLDPARQRSNLTVLAEASVDRLRLDGDRATGAEILSDGRREVLRADLVLVASGAYGSPAILLRSGIGPEDELHRHGIDPAAVLPVGEGLRDHFGVPVRFAPSHEMANELARHRAEADDATLQGVIKARTSSCPDGLWDLHLLVGVFPGEELVLASSAMLLQPEWAGSVGLRSTDPSELPTVTALDLETGDDCEAALEGVELARRLVATDALRDRVASELQPGPDATADQLRERGREGLTTYFHPVATCAMGPTTDATGRVQGFENLHVADASIIPRPLRASPNLTVMALAERMAEVVGG